MTSILAGDIYLNVRQAWYNEFINTLPHDDRVWRKHFNDGLAMQGAEIQRHDSLGCDILGVSGFRDSLVFKRDVDATKFILRWS